MFINHDYYHYSWLWKENEDFQHLNSLVQNLFTNIDESEYNEFNNVKDKSVDFFSDSSKVPEWIQIRFRDNMTEEGYKVFIETAMYNIPIIGYENNKNLKLENFKIKPSDKNYDFSGKLVVFSEEEQLEKSEITITGSAQTNEEGKVSYINVFNMDEIIEALNL